MVALLSASFDSLPDEDYGFNDDNGRLKAASSPTGAFIDKALIRTASSSGKTARPIISVPVPPPTTMSPQKEPIITNWKQALVTGTTRHPHSSTWRCR